MSVCQPCIIYFILIFGLDKQCETQYAKYVKRFVKYAKDDLKMYQIFLIVNTENLNSDSNNVFYPILSELPALGINLNTSKNNEKFLQLPSFDQPRANLLLVVFDDSFGNDTPKLLDKNTSDFLYKVRPERIRPKCLIISICNGSNCSYGNLLRQMWSEHYLDVTVLQFARENISKNGFQNLHSIKAKIHYFNPFTDVYESFQFSRQIDWFPDKLRDMNGFNLKAGLIPYPPLSIITFNATGHLSNYKGSDIIAFEVLARKLNFSTTLIASRNLQLGSFNFTTGTGTGMLRKLLTNEVNILISTLVTVLPTKLFLDEFSIMINQDSLTAIVPVLPGRVEELQQSFHYLTMIGLAMIIGSIHLASRIMKFDALKWQPDIIMKVLLGMSSPREPTTTPDRILFTSTLIVGFCYASSFFGDLTSDNLEVTREMQINTFEDLDKSELVPVIHPNIYISAFNHSEEALRNLKKKAVLRANSTFVDEVIKYKNISSVQLGIYAVGAVESARNIYGRSPIKIMKQPFWRSRTIMHFERGSPYKERLNEVLIRIRESGLRNKWDGMYSSDPSTFDTKTKSRESSEVDDLGRVTHLRSRLIFVILHGYVLSILVFIAEIVLNQIQRWIKRKRAG